MPTTAAGDAGEGGAPALELTATRIAFDTTTLRAGAGKVSIRFENRDDGIPHNLHVSGPGVDERTEVEEGPATQELELELEPGSYSYVCDVHPQQMRGELTVT